MKKNTAKSIYHDFIASESGASTIDFIVLSIFAAGFALSLILLIEPLKNHFNISMDDFSAKFVTVDVEKEEVE